MFSQQQKDLILRKLMDKVTREFETACENDTLQDLIDDYGIRIGEDEFPVNPKRSKILVVGSLAGKVKEFVMNAAKLNIPSTNIEFRSDYDKLTNNELTKLEYSDKYSDIIFGPIPHSMKGKGEATSIIEYMESRPDRYPRIIRAETLSSQLKLTITSFRNAIRKTRYLEYVL